MINYNEDKAHYVSVTGIIVKDGKYLISKRAEWEKAFGGKWTVPGGKLDSKDYKGRPCDTKAGQWYNICEDILRREVKEEVNLEIKNIRYLTSLVFVRPDGIPVLVISMIAEHAKGEVKLSEDMTEYAWVSLEEAKKYDLIDGIYEELEMVEKYMGGEDRGEWGK